MIPEEIKKAIQIYWAESGKSNEILNVISISGGSINAAFCIETLDESYFLKYNSASAHPQMFSTEFKGLELLSKTNTIRVPVPLFQYEGNKYSCILMEYIANKEKKTDFWELFARQLADMHKNSSHSFGLDFDNYMGSLVQSNYRHSSFVDFFINERLTPQIKLARDAGMLHQAQLKQGERLFMELPSIFPEEKPALVHGDLWSGNFMSDENGIPVIMDPAVYYGHREVDIAMTTMFGGFSSPFYEFYHQYHPLEKGWQSRLEFYKLYPILIHINLFGTSYLHSYNNIMRKF